MLSILQMQRLGRGRLVLPALVVLLVAVVSFSPDSNVFSGSRYRERLVEDLGRLPTSLQSMDISDHLKAYLLRIAGQDPTFCEGQVQKALTPIDWEPNIPKDLEKQLPLVPGFEFSNPHNPSRSK